MIAPRRPAVLAITIALMACTATQAIGQQPAHSPAGPPAEMPGNFPPMQEAEAPDETGAIVLESNSSVPGPQANGPEQWNAMMGDPLVRNVTISTLTPFLPEPGKANGAAVIVAPGGAFYALAMEQEGWAVARRLAEQGIAAFVLKYRLEPTPRDAEGFQRAIGARIGGMQPGAAPAPAPQYAVADGQAAVRLVRERAEEWGIDPAKVGMIGFSAGAMTTLAVALQSDGAELPDFIGPIYGPMSSVDVPADAPPMFAALAADDPLFGHQGAGLYESWLAAGIPVEAHFYERGGHGFGLGRPGNTTSRWFDTFVAWMSMHGFTGNAQSVAAGAGPDRQGPPPEMREQMMAEMARYNAMPDDPGTGPYPASKAELPSLPDHVVYRPSDLSAVPDGSLGVLAFGNGGCMDDGANARLHLLEISSHGYLAIANGTVKSGPGVETPPLSGVIPERPAGEPFVPPPPATSAAQLVEAIDWALAENARPESPLFGKIDTDAVAVSGWSCGGLQALEIAASDPRVATAVIHNSGIFPDGSGMGTMDIGKDTLNHLNGPVIYILGGPNDIAYPQGMDDFGRISSVPAAVANLGDIGHGGSFYQPNGGPAADLARLWLDWQLKGDEQAAEQFVGEDCVTCTDPDWSFQKRGLD